MTFRALVAAGCALLAVGAGGAVVAQPPVAGPPTGQAGGAPGGPPGGPPNFGLPAAPRGQPYAWTTPRPGEQGAIVAAISGVVDAGAKWDILTASYNNIDGPVGLADGSVIFAEEQSSAIKRVQPDGTLTYYYAGTHGGGAISIDAQGRTFVVERACTDPGLRLGTACMEQPRVSQIMPEQRVLATQQADGRGLGRVNDLIADGRGGVFFTSGGAYHVDRDGKVVTVAADIRANGIMLSPDGRTLYVTNNSDVQAWDVAADGTTTKRRTFGELSPEGGGDGMAIDGQGRLYVSGGMAVHVFSAKGDKLGVIPTPRRAIALAFGGVDKRTLFLVGLGAVGPDGQDWWTPAGIRNTAMTLYKLPMTAEGYRGRPK